MFEGMEGAKHALDKINQLKDQSIQVMSNMKRPTQMIKDGHPSICSVKRNASKDCSHCCLAGVPDYRRCDFQFYKNVKRSLAPIQTRLRTLCGVCKDQTTY